MKYLVQRFQGLTMTRQILMIQILLLFIIIGLFIVLFKVHTTMLISQVTHVQSELFIKLSRSSLNSMLELQRNLILIFINLNGRNMIALHQLVLASESQQFTQSNQMPYDYTGSIDFPSSIQITDKGMKGKYSYSFLCGSNKTSLNNSLIYHKYIQGTSNMLGIAGIMLNSRTVGINNFVYGGLFSDPEVIYSYPCVQMGSKFDPYQMTQRPWYVKSKEQYQQQTDVKYQLTFTDPYVFSTGGGIDVGLNLAQVNSKNEFIGAWTMDVQGGLFTRYLQQNTIADMVLLTTLNGILIAHNYENKDMILPLYFYNYSVTGFTINEWNIINNNDLTQNNCDIQFTMPGYVCLKNQLTGKNLHVFITSLKEYKLKIIMFLDLSKNLKQIEIENQFILDVMNDELQTLILYSMLIFVFLVAVFGVLMAKAITNPITHIISMIYKALKPNSTQYIFQLTLKTIVVNATTITNLLKSFKVLLLNFTGFKIKKGKECKIQNNYLIHNGIAKLLIQMQHHKLIAAKTINRNYIHLQFGCKLRISQ